MKTPLVSVQMITYNHAPLIERAVGGVLQQKTVFPFELIIGEDCSTDGTKAIVLRYQEKHPDIISVITSEKNVGMKENSFRTLKACKGKYIAFCEGDDYWQHPEKLQKQVDYLESHPECGLTYSDYDVYHVKSKKLIKNYISYRNIEMPRNIDIHDILENKNGFLRGFLTCTVMARRVLCDGIIESDPYLHQEDKFLMSDTQLWAEIAAISKLHFMQESLATHNITEESATRSRDIRKVLSFAMSNAELLLYLCSKYDATTQLRNRYNEYWCNNALRLALYTRNSQLADEVRRRKSKFTLKEFLRYCGARSLVICYFYRAVAFLISTSKKNHYEWS